ncbi:unnamed protein product [Adineta steineri]|uniref:Uncharacterized protein n=1 Tax=Adineta steineri TaxID=433720 RepID=A0A818UQL2_9BILA|nr:unnamed protein product [Adineta steineri]
MAQGNPSTVTFPPSYNPADTSGDQQPWMFLFTTIHPISSSQLQSVGICYIILGLVSIAVETAILSGEVKV